MMNIDTKMRGFETLTHPSYPKGLECRLVGQSSIIGDYEDSFDRPGSSAIWVGNTHHLNREETKELIVYLQRWLDTGKLS